MLRGIPLVNHEAVGYAVTFNNDLPTVAGEPMLDYSLPCRTILLGADLVATLRETWSTGYDSCCRRYQNCHLFATAICLFPRFAALRVRGLSLVLRSRVTPLH